MLDAPTEAPAPGQGPGERYRIAFFHAVEGDLRFISHHDTLRLFRRAAARAGLSVRYSQGFNPLPRIMIPLPRPLGIASDAEAVVIELDAAPDPVEVAGRLAAELPVGIRLMDARLLNQGENLRPGAVEYRLDLDSTELEPVASRVAQLRDAERLEVDRVNGPDGSRRRLDLRPYLTDIAMDGGRVLFALTVTGGGTARPSEIAGLLGLDEQSVNHRITRTRVHWHDN